MVIPFGDRGVVGLAAACRDNQDSYVSGNGDPLAIWRPGDVTRERLVERPVCENFLPVAVRLDDRERRQLFTAIGSCKRDLAVGCPFKVRFIARSSRYANLSVGREVYT
jgi:hypothetical protein